MVGGRDGFFLTERNGVSKEKCVFFFFLVFSFSFSFQFATAVWGSCIMLGTTSYYYTRLQIYKTRVFFFLAITICRVCERGS